MKGRIAGLACIGPLAALAFAGQAAAQATSTTIIEHHKVVREEAPSPAPPPATVVHKTTSVTRTVKTDGPVRPAHRVVAKRRTTVAKARSATVVEKTTAVSQPPAPPPPVNPPVATIDRKTVIHQDEAGDVHTRTRIERQDANGDTTVIHKSTDAPAEPPPVEPAPLP